MVDTTSDAGEQAPEDEAAGRRPGRWRTGAESRRRILRAARSSFAERGYDRTTVRAVAAAAGVDPAMVHYFFTTKSRLFAEAMAFPVNPADRVTVELEGGVDGLGERIVRHFLQVWDDDAGGFEPLAALLRSAPTDDSSSRMLREFVQREIAGRFEAALGGHDPRLRAELVGSQLMGLALARYVVRLEPLASADVDTVAAWVGPALQTYLTPQAPPRP